MSFVLLLGRQASVLGLLSYSRSRNPYEDLALNIPIFLLHMDFIRILKQFVS